MLLLAAAAFGSLAADGNAPEPELSELRGSLEKVIVQPGETLLEIAHLNRLGFEAIARLNPGVDPWIPAAGTIVELPTRFILPPGDREGLVINVPEMRLYDFSVTPVEVFAVAIGDREDPSVLGEYRVGEKRANPAWTVPQSIRLEKPDLPAVVPPGPGNPLGSRWMTIGATSYGIHGTNLRWSIGREATHGCIRLYEDEIQRLYARVPRGTRIQLVYAPYKWAARGGRLYLEAHPDVYERMPDRLWHALQIPRARGLLSHVDLEAVMRTVDAARGMPMAVGVTPPATSTP